MVLDFWICGFLIAYFFFVFQLLMDRFYCVKSRNYAFRLAKTDSTPKSNRIFDPFKRSPLIDSRRLPRKNQGLN